LVVVVRSDCKREIAYHNCYCSALLCKAASDLDYFAINSYFDYTVVSALNSESSAPNCSFRCRTYAYTVTRTAEFTFCICTELIFASTRTIKMTTN
jgi:hypothetical protein